MVIGTDILTLTALSRHMLYTGLGLKLGLHHEEMEPWHSIVTVKPVNTAVPHSH
jgi:hypothetical protein